MFGLCAWFQCCNTGRFLAQSHRKVVGRHYVDALTHALSEVIHVYSLQHTYATPSDFGYPEGLHFV